MIPNNKGMLESITIPDLKLCYKAIVVKIVWYLHKNTYID